MTISGKICDGGIMGAAASTSLAVDAGSRRRVAMS
jgi:hypothetical protein